MSIEDARNTPPGDDKAFRKLMERINGAEGKIPTTVEDIYTQLFGDPSGLSDEEMMKKILRTYSEEDFVDFCLALIDPKDWEDIMLDDDDIEKDWQRIQKGLRDKGLLGDDGDKDEDPKP